MRIEDGTVDNRINGGAGAVEGLGPDSKSSSANRQSLHSDTVALSDAGNWIGLAKGSVSAAQQQKIASVTEQLRSGQYHTDVTEISKAVVGGHLRGLEG
jgi:anti-sigma28 factor (negative regulator of flagellin synthesis)